MTTISIALATYNGERFLQDQLDSLKSQTKRPDELVICDDKSTDSTLTIIDRFASSAPFHVEVHQNDSNIGYRANFMQCVRKCTSDLIAFCDQDDIWLDKKLQRQSDIISTTEAHLSFHPVDIIDEAGTRLNRRIAPFNRPFTSSYSMLPPFPFALGMTICMRRACTDWDALWSKSVDFHKGSEPMAHDQWFPFIASLMGKVHYSTESLALYRRHTSNTSSTDLEASPLKASLGKFRSRSAEYRRLHMSASRSASLIRDITDLTIEQRGGIPSKRQLDDAIIMYETFADSLLRRTQTAETKMLHSKFLLLYRSILSGDYRFNSKWHFRPISIVRDLLE